METYCVSCKKTTVKENRSVRKPKQNRLIVPIKYKKIVFIEYCPLKT